MTADADGFLRLGDVGVLIESRADVSARNPEPGRVIINLHVEDAQATAKHLDELGASWVAALEYREARGSALCWTPTGTTCRSSS